MTYTSNVRTTYNRNTVWIFCVQKFCIVHEMKKKMKEKKNFLKNLLLHSRGWILSSVMWNEIKKETMERLFHSRVSTPLSLSRSLFKWKWLKIYICMNQWTSNKYDYLIEIELKRWWRIGFFFLSLSRSLHLCCLKFIFSILQMRINMILLVIKCDSIYSNEVARFQMN